MARKTKSHYKQQSYAADIRQLRAEEERRLGRSLHRRPLTDSRHPFRLKAPFQATGDQPEAIRQLVDGVREGLQWQTLLGVTGSGKTFTMANIIQELQRPTLVLAPNKTLAGQLCSEFRAFFPHNRVEYFVSYYDYYQPEAYIPASDTYIEKDSAINDEIDRMRHAATASLLSRRDVIVVASVSCIYGLGDPEDYEELMLHLRPGDQLEPYELLRRLANIQYVRNDFDLRRGCFSLRGDIVDIMPSSENSRLIRVAFFDDEIEEILEVDPLNGEILGSRDYVLVYPASHYTTSKQKLERAILSIGQELEQRLAELRGEGKILEAYRLEQRTRYDLEMLAETGFTKGIENYSRHISGRAPGSAPYTLLDFFPDDYLLFIDESHVSVPQVGGMYNGDHARKVSLVDYGFRLPSSFDNRPLRFPEFEARMGQTIFVSATPGPYEEAHQEQQVEQMDDLLLELKMVKARGERALLLTKTKRLSENLSQFLSATDIRAAYLHSELENDKRLQVLDRLRRGELDCVVGINLLREGLDLPEVSLIAIMDADQAGFLRSRSSLIQMIGRAARNVHGKVLMYADEVSQAMQEAVEETQRRRQIQMDYNRRHGIEPRSVTRELRAVIQSYEDLTGTGAKAKSQRLEPAEEGDLLLESARASTQLRRRLKQLELGDLEGRLKRWEQAMQEAAEQLDFEEAARLRDLLIEGRGVLEERRKSRGAH